MSLIKTYFLNTQQGLFMLICIFFSKLKSNKFSYLGCIGWYIKRCNLHVEYTYKHKFKAKQNRSISKRTFRDTNNQRHFIHYNNKLKYYFQEPLLYNITLWKQTNLNNWAVYSVLKLFQGKVVRIFHKGFCKNYSSLGMYSG